MLLEKLMAIANTLDDADLARLVDYAAQLQPPHGTVDEEHAAVEMEAVAANTIAEPNLDVEEVVHVPTDATAGGSDIVVGENSGDTLEQRTSQLAFVEDVAQATLDNQEAGHSRQILVRRTEIYILEAAMAWAGVTWESALYPEAFKCERKEYVNLIGQICDRRITLQGDQEVPTFPLSEITLKHDPKSFNTPEQLDVYFALMARGKHPADILANLRGISNALIDESLTYLQSHQISVVQFEEWMDARGVAGFKVPRELILVGAWGQHDQHDDLADVRKLIDENWTDEMFVCIKVWEKYWAPVNSPKYPHPRDLDNSKPEIEKWILETYEVADEMAMFIQRVTRHADHKKHPPELTAKQQRLHVQVHGKPDRSGEK